MNKLPKESSSQEIGRLAGRAISSKLPVSWIETPQSGDCDFGIDYLIQLKNSQGDVCYSFYLQLKGTTVPIYISDGDFVSFSFKTSTLAYYYAQEPLVMVAIVDLSVHSDELSKCPIYFMWLDEDWFDLNKDKIESQEHLTLNIPTNQEINTKLDVFSFYEKRIFDKIAIQGLKKAIKPHSDDISRSIINFSEYIEDKPIILKAIEESGDEPWISNPNGQAATLLKKCSDALNENLIFKAKEFLSQLDSWPNKLSDHECAELYLQRSLICSLSGETSESFENIKISTNYSDKPRYKLAFFEEKIKNGQMLTQEELNEIEPEVLNGDFRSTYIKAKCMAISGNIKEAVLLMKEKHNERIAARLLLLTLDENPDELDRELVGVDHDMLISDREKYIFYALAARRNFFKAHGDSFNYDQVLPFTGKSNLNFNFMRLSYEYCDKAWNYAKRLGYPSDFAIIIDISPVLYFYFNNIEPLFERFDEILKERPGHFELCTLYSRILYNCDEYEKVVLLLSRINTRLSLDDKSILFASNFYLKEYDSALKIFLSIEKELLDKSPENTPFVLCLAIEVAVATFSDSLADRLRTILLTYENGEAFWAVSTCVRSVREEPGTQSDCIDKLYQKYIELDKPLVIAEHLLRFLNVRDENNEGKIIEVAEDILKDKELDEACSLKLAEAYLKSGDTNKVFEVVEKNLEKVNVDPHWHVIKTYALELSGRIGEAVDEIEKALKGNNYSPEYMKLYVNKCLSFGMFSQVEGVLQRLISGEGSRKNKLIYLSKLITVYSSSLEYREKLISSIKRFGELVDRNDCDEEGRYLSFVLSASIDMSEDKKKLFGVRISEYFKNFPDSKVLRKANVDVNNGPEALLNSIREVTGVTDELVAQWEKNKRSIRNGSLPVPFAMLDLFLSNTNDIYTSWMLAKNTPEEELEFKINQAAQSSQENFDDLLEKGNSIFIEETTLILMHELSVLDFFLGSVRKFIILSSCFERMNSLGFSVVHGIVNHLPQGILNTITKHRAKLIIEQDNKENRLESYRKAISKNESGYIFLTDDANILMLCGSGVNTLIHGNIYNVLLNLNRNNHIQEKELFELIAKVSTYGFKSINMETDLMARVFCHFLSENKDYTKTAFKSLFDKVFSSRFKFDEVVGVLYRFLSFIVDDEKIKVNAGIILSLLTNFLLRHPHDNKVDFILKWFLYQCVTGKVHYISTLLPMSVAHAALWSSCYEMCCIAMDREISSDEIFTKVCSCILEQKENDREHIYNSVTKCFIPGTADYESFSRIYKELSLIINVRNN
ncbi:DUF4365 domain-containing protein [Pantoea sp. BL1]|uniref:DUF4365 domain-containing protein n=1 Tax=Pantoea sp. BL1 TaxID=1628190 RepID=UPI0006992529|nr:DUF4365 domain-containing protein [Pantoea sp. BL1]